MGGSLEYGTDRASEAQVLEHLARCNAAFPPPLSGRTDLPGYVRTLMKAATRFEAWADGVLVGLLAAYFSDEKRITAFVSNVSVLPERARQGVATRLLELFLERAKAAGLRQVRLDVAEANTPALRLYEKSGFALGGRRDGILTLQRDL